MSYIAGAALARAIREAVAYNRTTAVEPKTIIWTDFPDTDEDLFGPNTREDTRTPNPVRRRRSRLFGRLAGRAS